MQADLTAAIKARDLERVAVLRSALSALANAEAVAAPNPSSTPVAFGSSEVDRRALGEADERAVIALELHELEAAADELRGLGRQADAEALAARAVILASYLTAGPS
jgi:hypothetical protein